MASFKQMWEVLKDGARISSDLNTGGCFNEYVIAMIMCGHESFVEGIDRKPAEFIPVDLDACVSTTAALRRCMQGNPDVSLVEKRASIRPICPEPNSIRG
jgi:hypothetical protein